MRAQTTTFRFTEAELAELSQLADEMGLSQADVVRALVASERERRGLGRARAERFIRSLRERFGAEARLELEVDPGGRVNVTINGEPAEMADPVRGRGDEDHPSALAIFHDERRAYLHLDDSDTGACLRIADVYVPARLTLPLAALTPDMHEPDAHAPSPRDTLRR